VNERILAMAYRQDK